MERIVRILNQSGLQTRQYMDRKTGDQRVINTVVLKLPQVRPTVHLQGAVYDDGTRVELSADWRCYAGHNHLRG